MIGYLVHHGIKGQKWGVRRYQNPDGSLTGLGRKHYASVEAEIKGIEKNYEWSKNNFEKKKKRYSGKQGKQNWLRDNYGDDYKYWMDHMKIKDIDKYAKKGIKDELRDMEDDLKYSKEDPELKKWKSIANKMQTKIEDLDENELKEIENLVERNKIIYGRMVRRDFEEEMKKEKERLQRRREKRRETK